MSCKMSWGVSYLIDYAHWTFTLLMPVIYIRWVCQLDCVLGCVCKPHLNFLALWGSYFLCFGRGCWPLLTENVIGYVMCGICSLICDRRCQTGTSLLVILFFFYNMKHIYISGGVVKQCFVLLHSQSVESLPLAQAFLCGVCMFFLMHACFFPQGISVSSHWPTTCM